MRDFGARLQENGEFVDAQGLAPDGAFVRYDGEGRPRAGLAALAELDPTLPRYTAAAAYLHERDGDLDRAAELYAQAARAATSAPERDHLTRQAARLHAELRDPAAGDQPEGMARS